MIVRQRSSCHLHCGPLFKNQIQSDGLKLQCSTQRACFVIYIQNSCGGHRMCSLRIKRMSVKRGLTVLSEMANDLSTNESLHEF